MSRYIIKYP